MPDPIPDITTSLAAVTVGGGAAGGGPAADDVELRERDTAPLAREVTRVITVDGALVPSGPSAAPTWENALRRSPQTEPDQALLRAVKRMKGGLWPYPTPIQEQMHHVIGSKRNYIGQAMGGQGKTGAFAATSFVVVDKAAPGPQVLVLEKTRGLVLQVRRPAGLCARILRAARTLFPPLTPTRSPPRTLSRHRLTACSRSSKRLRTRRLGQRCGRSDPR